MEDFLDLVLDTRISTFEFKTWEDRVTLNNILDFLQQLDENIVRIDFSGGYLNINNSEIVIDSLENFKDVLDVMYNKTIIIDGVGYLYNTYYDSLELLKVINRSSTLGGNNFIIATGTSMVGASPHIGISSLVFTICEDELINVKSRDGFIEKVNIKSVFRKRKIKILNLAFNN